MRFKTFMESAPTTPEFKKWFAGSVVVDDKGNPDIVYHGGPKGIKKFQSGTTGIIYFTHDKTYADAYAKRRQGDGAVYKAYLSLKNPANHTYSNVIEIIADVFNDDPDVIFDAFDQGYDAYEYYENPEVIKRLKAAGYDGILFDEEGQQSVGVFSPDQIRIVKAEKI